MSFHARYAQELARCGFRADPAQQAAVDALEDLRRRLIEREPGASPDISPIESASGL